MKLDKNILVTEILAHMAGNIGYSECIALIREKRHIADRTFARYWLRAKEIKEGIEDQKRQDIAKRDANAVLSLAKRGVKSKNDKIIDIQNEIETIAKYIDQGFIKRKIKIDGVLYEKTELLMTAELRHLHTIIETKRDRLSKLLGEYAPQQKEVKNVKELTEKTPSIIVTNARYSNSTIESKGQQSTDNQDK